MKTKNNNYINYSPFGAGDSDARHGYNGEIGKNSKYLLGEGNRLYISSLGVFNQKDNLNVSNGGGVNTYIYGNQNPINQYDPSGNSSTGFYAGNIIGIAAGIAGIVFAIPTGGASLSVSGGVSIALASAEVAATTASVALYSTDHQEGASITGWVAMGLGLASLGSSSISAFSGRSVETVAMSDSISSTRTMSFSFNVSEMGSVELEAPYISSTHLNSLGLLESIDLGENYGARYVYRVDVADPKVVRDFGFERDTVFYGVPNMIDGDIIAVSSTLEGAEKYHQISTPRGVRGYVYSINITGMKGVSLDYNLKNYYLGIISYIRSVSSEPYNVSYVVNNANKMMLEHFKVEPINLRNKIEYTGLTWIND